jgi:hypothetical protein
MIKEYEFTVNFSHFQLKGGGGILYLGLCANVKQQTDGKTGFLKVFILTVAL